MDSKDKQVQVQTFNVKPSLAHTKKLVKEMMKFIDDNRLSVNIAGKKYLQVEAWQFAGSQLNLTAVVTEITDISTDTTPRFSATVEIYHNPTGQLVSRGFAMCSKAETKKKSFDEYAVMSMAQTRAIGKAYRNILAWLVKMAGFEGTPVEEVSDNIREDMEADLAKYKRDVVAKFNSKGYKTATEMVKVINKVLDKETIDDLDDAMAVIAELDKEDEVSS